MPGPDLRQKRGRSFSLSLSALSGRRFCSPSIIICISWLGTAPPIFGNLSYGDPASPGHSGTLCSSRVCSLCGGILSLLLVQSLVSLITAGLILSLFLRRFRFRSVAVVFTLLFCFWPWVHFYTNVVLAETLAILWIALLMHGILVVGAGGRRAFAVGLVLALAVLTRSVLVIIFPLALLWIGWRWGRTGLHRLLMPVICALGFLVLVGPYAAGIRLLYGQWGITHFSGWALFGLTGQWTDIASLDDPEVRRIFESAPLPMSELAPGEIRWSSDSPAQLLLKRMDEKASRPPLDRDRLLGAVSNRKWRVLWTEVVGREPHPWVLTDRILLDLAMANISRHPYRYVESIAVGLRTFFLWGGEHPKYFSSIREARELGISPTDPSLSGALAAFRSRGESYAMPETGGWCLAPARVAYKLRPLFLLPIVVGFVLLRRQLLKRDDLLVALLSLLCLALFTAAVTEVYDRYTVPALVPLILAGAAATDGLIARWKDTSRGG